MNGSQVTITNVSKQFGDFIALNNINFTIRQGEFFTLLGPSGCGKTTLLRIIAGFENPDEGAILFDETNVVGVPPNKRHSNTVFQSYALFPHMSVFENVAFSLRLKKTDNATVEKKVREYLSLVQLEEHMYKKPNQLSGGQRQRVAIARALINEPKVLLLDEPLSALDAKLRSNLLVELDRLHDKIGITFIFVTHDQTEALAVSDRIAVMNKGNVLQIGTPYEIYESPATQFVAQFIGETNLFESKVVNCESYKAKTGEEYMVTLNVPALGMQAQLSGDTQATKEEDKNILVTDYEHTDEGQAVAFTIRPEKIRITLNEPDVKGRKDINVFKGIVEEPVYTGFQSKFIVKLEKTGTIINVYKQHTNYLDDGPEIQWKDTVYISWSAEDGYIVEDIEK
ncbi:ABC transporter ATP-binding protein [Treponema pectinovorum]|uniref:ABC transporter ATP-binding protein n=1 Tax=Treponema pectinovorum TaxID=164 RepID=UPI0011C78BEA|nr:ABC transporter ATP-binding protein [Treponema pectinovorum]